MKICFFAHYSITNQDGATLSMYNIIDELQRRGVEVVVVLANTANLEKRVQDGKTRFIRLPMYGMRMDIEHLTLQSRVKFAIKHLLNERCVDQAVKQLKDENIDLIHINGLDSSVGAKVAKRLGVPYVWHIRQFMEADLGKKLYEQERVYQLVREANSVIAISNDVRNKFEPILGREVDVVYNGVPTEQYLIEDKPCFKNEKVSLLLAGRISEQKGQMIAVKAVEILRNQGKKDIELTLVGQGETKAYISSVHSYIQEKNLCGQVHIIDHTDDLTALRESHDIGLTCSKKEAFGRVTIENQMAGLMVIGANTGGTLEIIDDGVTGLLYEEGNANSLAEKINYALEHKDEAMRIAEAGQEKALKIYSIERVVDEIIEIYKRCIPCLES